MSKTSSNYDYQVESSGEVKVKIGASFIQVSGITWAGDVGTLFVASTSYGTVDFSAHQYKTAVIAVYAQATPGPSTPPPGTSALDNWDKLFKDMATWWTSHQQFMTDTQKLFAYQGFDALAVFAALEDAAKNPVKSRHDDYAMLVILAVERGANLANIKKKTSDDGKKVIDELIKKYSLKSKPNKKNDLTLPRISLVLPWLTCSYMAYTTNHVVPVPMLPTNYPAFMKNAAFANFIPMDDTVLGYERVKLGFALHQVYFGEQINPGDKQTKKEKAIKALKFIELGMKSPFLSNKTRHDHLMDWKIITRTGSPEAPVEEAAKIVETWLATP